MNKFQSLGTGVPCTPSILHEAAPGPGDPGARRLLRTTLSSLFSQLLLSSWCGSSSLPEQITPQHITYIAGLLLELLQKAAWADLSQTVTTPA